MSDLQSQSLTLSGEISSTQDQTATLSVGGSYLTARRSGDHLNLGGAILLSSFQPTVLQAIPSTQVENALTTAFSRAIVAGKHLKNLQFILNKEVNTGQEILFPIRLDNTVLESNTLWAKRLRQRHIGDFTGWQDDPAYQQALATLLQHLKVAKTPTQQQ